MLPLRMDICSCMAAGKDCVPSATCVSSSGAASILASKPFLRAGARWPGLLGGPELSRNMESCDTAHASLLLSVVGFLIMRA